jgi:hypothetical protein
MLGSKRRGGGPISLTTALESFVEPEEEEFNWC